MNIFTKHPHATGESYFTHLKFACSASLNLLYAATACMIHAVFPFFFKHTASNILIQMLQNIIRRRAYDKEKFSELMTVIEKNSITK